MERKIGLSSARALESASSPHENQSTGFCACWSRYGDVSFARRFAIRHPERSEGSQDTGLVATRDLSPSSRLRMTQLSRPRVGLLIHLNELPICEMGVLLGRRQRGVAEELLDCAEVGAGVQKVRCERMAQRVRRNSCSQ